MNAAQRAPNKVLIQIFQQVPRRTVYQCIYVCKAWSFATIQGYYKELSLTINNHLLHILTGSSTDQVADLIGNGEYVKSLVICKSKLYS
jgi:hypothetical protein